jgi:beta-fructofuranosidase
MNDPKLFFHNGEYHVFLQHNPEAAKDGPKHWAHTVSRDLVHWKTLPIALSPTPGGPDAYGCWTGCVVGEGGKFDILYTAIPSLNPLKQVQSLATSDDLIRWEKYAGNPVIADAPEGFGPCFRDPCAWKEGDIWYMVIGSQVGGVGGAAILYRSPDLKRWTYLHPLFVGRTEETGHEFECPDFFPLGSQHVLLTSSGRTYWHVGDYADHKFQRDGWGVTDGGHFYAAKTLVDGRGRRILWGWVTEARPQEQQLAAGWSGVLSLPRELKLLPDHTLGIEPVEELKRLRGRHRKTESLKLSSETGETRVLPDVKGDALEIRVKFAPTDAREFGVIVRGAPDGSDGVRVTYNATDRKLGNAPLRLGDGEGLSLTVYVDRSVVEAFANGRACHTYRTYPEGSDRLRVGLFARGGAAEARSVDVWEMKSIY